MSNPIEQIKKMALILFAENGYEGTSLFDIAEGIGKKKQSLYTHFKNKDEIFTTIMEQVFNEEIQFVHQFFSQPCTDIQNILKDFILNLRDRYFQQENYNLKFVLGSSFLPPAHLKEETIRNANSYFNEIENAVSQLFLSLPNFSTQIDKAVLTFMTMLDGLFVALIYAHKERFDLKFMSSWDVYWKGIAVLKANSLPETRGF